MTIISQNARLERAARQYDAYAFREVQIAGCRAVYVTAPAKRGAAHSIYTVTFAGSRPRCNCPDFQQRCQDEGACKHVAMAARFLGVAMAAPPIAEELRRSAVAVECERGFSDRPDTEVERRALVAARMDVDFPND